ncbi:hypothetical protein GC207_09255 [bacterium]|nr:hypothetical protein [bacterium]
MRSTILRRLTTTVLTTGLGVGSALAGNLDQLQYFNVPGGTVATLYTAPNNTTFPDNPGYNGVLQYSELINPLLANPPATFIQTTGGNPQDSATYIRGFIEPPQTGSYTFWVSGSSDAELWLSTDTSPGNVGSKPIAYTGGSTGQNVWAARDSQRSAPVQLEKGKQYYFHMIQKSSGTGGLAQMGWWKPDFTLERPIPIRYAQRFPWAANCITGIGCSGSFTAEGSYTPPRVDRNPGNNSGTSDITFQTYENLPIDLTPWVTANHPVQFQWQELAGGPSGTATDIAGEITSTKYIESGTVADNDGKTYRLKMTQGTTVSYTKAVTLRVLQDFTSPTIVAANAAGNTMGFNVIFSENVDPSTATNSANYTCNNGVTVDHVEMRYGETPNNTVVVYTTGSIPGNTTVTVKNVADLSTYQPGGNPINENGVDNVADVLLTDGIISQYRYGAVNGGDGIGGTVVSDMVNNTNRFTDPYIWATNPTDRREFPGLPDDKATPSLMEVPVNVANNYGAMLVGYLYPPQTGTYNFVISSDDQSILYLSPDADPAHRVAIAAEVQWNGSRAYTSRDRRSASAIGSGSAVRDVLPGQSGPATADGSNFKFNESKNVDTTGTTTLIKGNKYYIEALMKEGGGGDNLSVTWQLPGSWTAGDNTTGLSDNQDPIPGIYLSQYAAAGQVGPIHILTQPQGGDVGENIPITFSVVHDGAQSYTYQWYKNGTIIPDANARQFTLPQPDPVTDQNAAYTVVIRNLFSEAISDAAVLNVIADTNAPTLVRAVGSDSYNKATIWFSENVNETEAVNPANYAISGLSILGTGTLGGYANGGYSQVTFNTTQQSEGTEYEVTVNNVHDIANAANAIAADSKVKFHGFVKTKGFVVGKIYRDIGGTAVSGLTSSPNFPDNPNESHIYSQVMFGLGPAPAAGNGGDTYGDNFGIMFSGTITAPATASYRFFTRSDDASQFIMNTSGSSLPSYTATPLAQETGCCTGFVEPPDAKASAPVSLTAGTQYGFVYMVKEGGGGDWGALAMRREGDSTPAANLPYVAGNICCAIANPDENTFAFTSEPQDGTADEGLTLTFSAAGNGQTLLNKLANPPTSAPVAWQWQKKATNDGAVFVDIAGAYSATYTTAPLTPADNGAQYRAVASIPGLSTPSAPATATVGIDTIKPTVLAITGSQAQNQVKVYFSEPVNQSEAETLGNYSITSPALTINSAKLSADGKVVTLTTAAQTPGTQYTVSVNGIHDIATAKNPLDPSPTTKTITAWTLATGVVRQQLYFDIGGDEVTLTNDSHWPNNPSTDTYLSAWDTPPSDCCGAPNRENFGTRMTGLITPTETADYYFAISGDDHQLFFLSTDASPAHTRLIVAEPQWNGWRSWNTTDRRIGGQNYFPDVTTLPINRSQNTVGKIHLEAGVSYYGESIGKEGGGGDSSAVTWWKDGDTMPADNTSGILGTFVKNYVNPDNQIIIATQPQSQSATAGSDVTFSVAATTYEPKFGGPITYQWRKNGTAISGANGSSYTAAGVTSGDNAATFDVVMNAPGAPQATSAQAILTVGGVVDPGAPTLTVTKSGNNVTVSYPADAQAAGHALEKSTALPGGFAADGSGSVSGANYSTTVDVSAQGAADQTYWRTKK